MDSLLSRDPSALALSEVTAILETNPNACERMCGKHMRENTLFWFPIHHACHRRHSLEILKFLVSVSPLAVVLKQDKNGDNLLHLFLRSTQLARLDTANWFVKKFPHFLNQTNNFYQTPLNLLLCLSARPTPASLQKVIEIYAKACPSSISVPDRCGRTALQSALFRPFPSLDTFNLLLNTCPEAAGAYNRDRGHSPLHLAVVSCTTKDSFSTTSLAWMATIEKLILLHPQALMYHPGFAGITLPLEEALVYYSRYSNEQNRSICLLLAKHAPQALFLGHKDARTHRRRQSQTSRILWTQIKDIDLAYEFVRMDPTKHLRLLGWKGPT